MKAARYSRARSLRSWTVGVAAWRASRGNGEAVATSGSSGARRVTTESERAEAASALALATIREAIAEATSACAGAPAAARPVNSARQASNLRSMSARDIGIEGLKIHREKRVVADMASL